MKLAFLPGVIYKAFDLVGLALRSDTPVFHMASPFLGLISFGQRVPALEIERCL